MSDVASATADDRSAAPSPTALVRRFLDLLQRSEVEAATALMAEDVEFVNVSLPAVRSRDRVRRLLGRALGLPGAGLEVYIHGISTDGDAVVTQRTDVLVLGPVRVQVWVWGRFDVVDGRIATWREYFDWGNVAFATLRGLVGAVIPGLRPSPPPVQS